MQINTLEFIAIILNIQTFSITTYIARFNMASFDTIKSHAENTTTFFAFFSSANQTTIIAMNTRAFCPLASFTIGRAWRSFEIGHRTGRLDHNMNAYS